MSGRSRLGSGTVITVAALSAAFGGILTQAALGVTGLFAAAGFDQIEAIAAILGIICTGFFGIAMFVGSIVTANAVSTTIAGRTPEIALLRLLGASSRTLRGHVVLEGLRSGITGSLIGVAAAVALVAGGAELAVRTGTVPRFDYPLLSPWLLLPVIAVIATTVAAAWSGSRRVLQVTPAHATGSSAEPRYEELRGRLGRTVVSVVLVVVGAAVVAGGVALGLINEFGVLLGLLGGMISFSGVILGAPVLLPPLISLVGRLFGRGPVARLASANAIRNPVRSARSVLGLVIGVTLVTMYAVAAATFGDVLRITAEANPAVIAPFEQFVPASTAIMSVLLGFSILLATVSTVDTLALSVQQRRRELGLLRTLGFTASQVRSMVALEAAQMILAALLLGTVLGTVYGWCAAVSTFGSLPGVGLIPPTVPPTMLIGTFVVGTVITIISAALPAQRAMRVTPVEALNAL